MKASELFSITSSSATMRPTAHHATSEALVNIETSLRDLTAPKCTPVVASGGGPRKQTELTLSQAMDHSAHRLALMGIELFCIDLGNRSDPSPTPPSFNPNTALASDSDLVPCPRSHSGQRSHRWKVVRRGGEPRGARAPCVPRADPKADGERNHGLRCDAKRAAHPTASHIQPCVGHATADVRQIYSEGTAIFGRPARRGCDGCGGWQGRRAH